MKNYIFVVNDFIIGTNKFTYTEIIEMLLERKHWIFPEKGVPKLNVLNSGDRVLLYIAGYGRRHFYGSFIINSKVEKLSNSEGFYKFFSKKIMISNIKKFSNKIYLKDIKDKLEFIKDKKNYGLHLRHSVKEINNRDYKLIMDEIES